MKVKIQSIHFDADQKLIDFIQDKTNKLSQVYDKIIDGEVILKLDKANETANKVCELKVNVPGKELFAKKQNKTFEEATDLAIEALRGQLVKHKDKTQKK